MADPASRRRETSDYGSRYKGPVGTGELGVTEVDIRELIEQLWGGWIVDDNYPSNFENNSRPIRFS